MLSESLIWLHGHPNNLKVRRVNEFKRTSFFFLFDHFALLGRVDGGLILDSLQKMNFINFHDAFQDSFPLFKSYPGTLVFPVFVRVRQLSEGEDVQQFFSKKGIEKNLPFKLFLSNFNSRAADALMVFLLIVFVILVIRVNVFPSSNVVGENFI